MTPLANSITKDFRIFFCAGSFLTLLGFVFVYSASSVYALDQYGSAHSFLFQHITAFLAAVLAAAVCYVVPLAVWQRHAGLLFGVALLFIALPVMGPNIRIMTLMYGAMKWIELDAFLLLTAVLCLSSLLAQSEGKEQSIIRQYAVITLLFGFATVALLQQGRASTALLLIVVTTLVGLVARLSAWYVVGFASGIVSLVAGLQWLKPHFDTLFK